MTHVPICVEGLSDVACLFGLAISVRAGHPTGGLALIGDLDSLDAERQEPLADGRADVAFDAFLSLVDAARGENPPRNRAEGFARVRALHPALSRRTFDRRVWPAFERLDPTGEADRQRRERLAAMGQAAAKKRNKDADERWREKAAALAAEERARAPGRSARGVARAVAARLAAEFGVHVSESTVRKALSLRGRTVPRPRRQGG